MSKFTLKTPAELKAIASLKELCEYFNDLRQAMGLDPIRRFADRASADKRIAEATKEYMKKFPAAAGKAPKEKKEKAAGSGVRRGTNLAAPGFAPVACRADSKQSILVDTLARPEGASMDELIAALAGGNKPWTEVTVRSGFGWDLKKKGYGVRSEFVEGKKAGELIERFHLVRPIISGKPAVIPPHKPLVGASKAAA